MIMYYILSMIFYQVELLLSINFSDLSSDVKVSQYFVDFVDLFFDVSEDRSAIEGAWDGCVPVPAMFSE